MLREKVWQLSEEDKKAILALHERKNALNELFVTLSSPYLSKEERKILRDGIIGDLQTTNALYDEWWRVTPSKYGWKSSENGRWQIDFQTNEVFLERPAEPVDKDEPL